MDNHASSQEKAADKPALNILLIEDSDTDAFIIQNALHKYMGESQFSRATTLKSGEKILQKGETGVLLLDLGLPDTTGPADTYQQIKKWTDNIPVIIMTNLKDHDLAKVMVHEGAADFLNKDVIVREPKRIRDAIDFSIERHHAHRKLVSDKDKAVQDSKQKDTVISCFMGGYSVGNGGK